MLYFKIAVQRQQKHQLKWREDIFTLLENQIKTGFCALKTHFMEEH